MHSGKRTGMYISLSSLQLRRSGIHKWPNKAKIYIKSLGISFPVQKNASRLEIVFVVTHQDSCQKQATPAKDIYNVFMDFWIPDNQSGLGWVTIMIRYWQWRKNRRCPNDVQGGLYYSIRIKSSLYKYKLVQCMHLTQHTWKCFFLP